jgi:hypothetical protein
MDTAKPGLVAEALEGPFRFHPEISGVGPHIAGDEPRALKGADIAVFDGRDISGANAQLTLHVQKRLAQRCPFTPHQVAQRHIEHVVAVELRLRGGWRRDVVVIVGSVLGRVGTQFTPGGILGPGRSSIFPLMAVALAHVACPVQTPVRH